MSEEGFFHYFKGEMNPSKKLHLLILLLIGKLVIILPVFAIWITYAINSEGIGSESTVAFIRNTLWVISVMSLIFAWVIFRNFKKLLAHYDEERENAERELGNFSARLTSYMESPEHVSIYSLDKNLCYLDFNSLHRNEMKEVFHADISVGANIMDLLPKDFGDRMIGHYQKALTGEHFSVTRAFGDKYYTMAFNPVYEQGQRIIGFTNNIFDVTERIKAEQELEQYKNQLESIIKERTEQLERQTIFFQNVIDSLPNLIFVRDADHKYVLVNKAMADSFGMKPDNFPGKSIKQTHKDANDAIVFEAEDKGILAEDTVVEEESKHKYPDGTERWLYLSKRRMQVGDDFFLLGVHNDISNLKETELKLTEANNELKRTLNRLKSTQMRLLESEKMASLGQLTAGLAHEINNPINYVSGNVEPIRRDLNELREILDQHLPAEAFQVQGKGKVNVEVLFSELHSLLEGVEEGASRVKALMADLHTFSLPESSEKKPGDINEPLKSTINLIKPQLKSRIELKEKLGELPHVLCNVQQLRQVFLNLLTNAIQAVQGEGVIQVSSKVKNDQVIIAVKDSGLGISEDNIKRIFDPFFTTKEVGEGTGLGLSVSYRIVEDHQGKIQVKSKEGKGTTFKVILPVPEQISLP